MEAMAAEVPCVARRIRGNEELLESGLVRQIHDPYDWKNTILTSNQKNKPGFKLDSCYGINYVISESETIYEQI